MSCDLDQSKLIQSVKCPNVGGQKGGNCNPNYQSFSINKGCKSYNIPSASELAWGNRYSSQKGGKVENTNFNNATETEFVKEGINVNSRSQNAWINRYKQMGGNEMKYLSSMYIDSIFYYVDEKNLKSKLKKIFSTRFDFTINGRNENNQEKFEKHLLRMKLQMQKYRTKIIEGENAVNIIFYLGRNKVEEHQIKISRNRIRTINIITKFSNKQKGGKSNLTCYSMNVSKGINGSPEVDNCCTVNPSELLRGGKNKKKKQKGGRACYSMDVGQKIGDEPKVEPCDSLNPYSLLQKGGGGGNGYTIAVNKPPIGGRPEIDGYVEGCLPFFPGGTSSPRSPSNGQKGGVVLKKVGKSGKSGKSGNSLINLKGINKKQKAKLRNINGKGKIKYTDKELAEGTFKDGLLTGQGTLKVYNFRDVLMSILTGEFKDGKLNGRGHIEHKSFNGTSEGMFKDSKLNGKGIRVFNLSGITAEGNFKNGYFVKGKRTYKRGNLMEEDGVFEYEILQEGKQTFRDKTILDGKFIEIQVNGDYVDELYKGKKITYDKKKKIVEEGTFKDLKLNGKGKRTVNRKVEEGKFKNGILIK